MRLLVCGGAGYIGSHFVRVAKEKHEVVVLDNLLTGHRDSVPEDVRLIEGDIRDENLLDEVFSEQHYDGVVHFSASSIVPESMADPLKYYSNNLHGTMVLLQAMTKHGVDKIVFSSTAAVYGEPEIIPITEANETTPKSPYGETKLAMEKMIDWVQKAGKLEYVSLRYFNVAGAHESGEIGEDHSPETHLIPIVLSHALGKRESISVFGDDYDTKDGTCVRDYIHVMDLANAHLLAFDHLANGRGSDIFNLGSGSGYSVMEILDSAEVLSEMKFNRVISERRPGDPAVLIASSEKARRVLGWEREYTDIKKIIGDAYKWHKSHPDGYGDRND